MSARTTRNPRRPSRTIVPAMLFFIVCTPGTRVPSSRDTAPRSQEVAVSDSNGFVDSLSSIRHGEAGITQRRIEILQEEIRRYRELKGELPSNLSEILTLPQSDPNLRPQPRWLEDGWGRAIRYRLESGGTAYELRSGGPDGRVGTTDDIVIRYPSS